MSVQLASFILFFSTMLGVLPVVFFKTTKLSLKSFIEGSCAGAMLAASWISLLVPALDLSSAQYSQPFLGMFVVCTSLALGYLSLQFIHEKFPHTHENRGDEGDLENKQIKRTWLLTIAVALHNIPEGFAVGVGSHHAESLSLLSAIAVQNLPEGLIIALALKSMGVRFFKILFITSLTAFIEVLGALSGFYLFLILNDFLILGLAFAAGAMFFIICREMIPECYKESESKGSLGIIFGIILVIVIKTLVES